MLDTSEFIQGVRLNLVKRGHGLNSYIINIINNKRIFTGKKCQNKLELKTNSAISCRARVFNYYFSLGFLACGVSVIDMIKVSSKT